MRKLLVLTSLIEMTLGVALVISPPVVLNLLLAAETSEVLDAICRLSGFAFICLGIACYPSKNIAAVYNNRSPVVKAMFIYNFLAAVYLGYLKLGAGFEGILLLPASVIHSLITVYFIFVMIKEKGNQSA